MISLTHHVTGLEKPTLETILETNLRHMKCDALFGACAYTSIYGARFLKELASRRNIKRICLVTDIRDHITHPAALKLGMDSGWRLRVVARAGGIFHPKVFVGSRGHKRNVPKDPRMLLLGSGNLSKGGLINNVECSIVQTADVPIPEAAQLFNRLWSAGDNLTPEILKRYEISYQERNARRAPKDLFALGVADDEEPPSSGDLLQNIKPPRDAAIPPGSANATWAGLESFTGDFTLQVEFPSRVATILRRLITNAGGGTKVPMLCGDGVVRDINCSYYEDNGMYRVNIPHDVPGAENARATKSGIVIIEKIDGSTKNLKLTVVANSKLVEQARTRSFALGTLGKTSTRFYGWY